VFTVDDQALVSFIVETQVLTLLVLNTAQFLNGIIMTRKKSKNKAAQGNSDAAAPTDGNIQITTVVLV